MKINKTFLSLLLILSSNFTEAIVSAQKSSLQQQTEDCACEISVTDIFLHKLRKKYNEMYKANLKVDKEPKCLPESFLQNLEKFGQDVPFISDDKKFLEPEKDERAKCYYIRLSLVKTYKEKKDFLATLKLDDVKAGKYNSLDTLENEFQEWLKKKNQK